MNDYLFNLEEFIDTGVTVVENVFDDEEVENIRSNFHAQLKELGVDHAKLLSRQNLMDSGPRIKGKAASIFYNKWKMDAHLNEKVYTIAKYLTVNTFGIKLTEYDHPFEEFNDVIPYIDRVCYRLPDCIRPEGGLEMHLDRNPTDPYLLKAGGLKKWRPIQAMICLTDHYSSESGGLKVVKGFHKQIDQYFNSTGSNYEQTGGGEFCRLNTKSHLSLERKLEPIYAPKGSLLFFDNRLPHSTCSALSGSDTREVIFFSFIPKVSVNIKYCKEQLDNFERNIAPPAYIKDNSDKCDRDYTNDVLSEFQRKLLLFD